MNISIIGFGHLAQALSQGFFRNPDYQLKVSSPSLAIETRSSYLHTHHNNVAILPDADILILAVKPAQMAAVLTEIHDHVPPNLLVISVAAGLTLDWFEKRLPQHTPIIRAMPNLASKCAQGATPLLANSWVKPEQTTAAAALFSSCGCITWVKEETALDAFTALSGSGLAYILIFTDAMRQAAITLGLTQEDARVFATQTLQGAASLSAQPGQSLIEIQQQITSKAGTTAAALAVFSERHLNDIVLAAMTAAFNRSQHSLSKES